jgi:hypothetical protein
VGLAIIAGTIVLVQHLSLRPAIDRLQAQLGAETVETTSTKVEPTEPTVETATCNTGTGGGR